MSLISPLWINPSLPGQQPALNEFPGSIVKKPPCFGMLLLGCLFPPRGLSCSLLRPLLLWAIPTWYPISFPPTCLPSLLSSHVPYAPSPLIPRGRKETQADLASPSSMSTPLFQVYQRPLTTVAALGSDNLVTSSSAANHCTFLDKLFNFSELP